MQNSQLIIRSIVSPILFFIVLILSSWQINYWQSWLYLSMNLLFVILSFFISQKSKILIKERLKPGGSVIKQWDILLITLLLTTHILILIIAGLDFGRFNWSPVLNRSTCFIGLAITFVGQLVFFIAKEQNHFFSSVVRIQTERGHYVCNKGLYKFVRHPGYFGSILSTIGLPLLFGSLWSIIPAFIYIILVLIRTSFEDKALRLELNGYVEYAASTPYKILRGIW